MTYRSRRYRRSAFFRLVVREILVDDLYYNCSSIDMWYLHGPDRTTPYEVSLKAINDLYKEGKFKRFGISNYYAYVSLSWLQIGAE